MKRCETYVMSWASFTANTLRRTNDALNAQYTVRDTSQRFQHAAVRFHSIYARDNKIYGRNRTDHDLCVWDIDPIIARGGGPYTCCAAAVRPTKVIGRIETSYGYNIVITFFLTRITTIKRTFPWKVAVATSHTTSSYAIKTPSNRTPASGYYYDVRACIVRINVSTHIKCTVYGALTCNIIARIPI